MWWHVYACVHCFHVTKGNNYLTVGDEQLNFHLCWPLEGDYWAADFKTQLLGVKLLCLFCNCFHCSIWWQRDGVVCLCTSLCLTSVLSLLGWGAHVEREPTFQVDQLSVVCQELNMECHYRLRLVAWSESKISSIACCLFPFWIDILSRISFLACITMWQSCLAGYSTHCCVSTSRHP